MKTNHQRHLAGAISILALTTSAHAAVIATEFFNGYGTSDLNTSGLSGGTGAWTSNWSASDNGYASGANLSYGAAGYDNTPNLSGSSNGAASFASATASPSVTFRTLNDGDASTIWTSSLISMDGSDRAILWIDATASAGNDDFIGVIDGQIAIRYNGTTIGTNGLYGNNTNPNGNATFTFGTALLLAKLEVNNSGNDTLSFWFNPDLTGGEGGLGTATLSATGGDFFGDEIGGIGMLIAGTTGGNEYIDAIQVGTTFVDVVPEPSSMGLLGLGGACLLLRRRRI